MEKGAAGATPRTSENLFGKVALRHTSAASQGPLVSLVMGLRTDILLSSPLWGRCALPAAPWLLFPTHLLQMDHALSIFL